VGPVAIGPTALFALKFYAPLAVPIIQPTHNNDAPAGTYGTREKTVSLFFDSTVSLFFKDSVLPLFLTCFF
jgi:hypothetical protein